MSTKKKGRYGDPRKRKPLYGDLVRMAQPNGLADPRRLGGTIVGGGAHERGTALLDLTDAVIMSDVEVSVVEAVRVGADSQPVAFMTIDGRVNKTTDQVRVGFMFDSDGAAAIITELLALADRFGPDMLDDVTRRLTDLHRGKDVDLHWLRAAIDNVIDAADEPGAQLTGAAGG